MTWSPLRVVQVCGTYRREVEPLGTGTVVAPGRVLTARHVVFKSDGELEPGLTLRRGDWNISASVAWDGGTERDVVLLAFDGICPETDVSIVLDARDIGAREPWSTSGWADISRTSPTERETPHTGTTCPWALRGGALRVDLNVDAPPAAWAGLSGGGVVIGGRIVAVITEAPRNYEQAKLWATPVAMLWEAPGFKTALRLSRIEFDARVRDVRDAIATVLARHEGVANAIVDSHIACFQRQCAAEQLAEMLVQSLRAHEVARVLLGAHDRLVSRRAVEDADALWEMLLRLLPILGEWRDLVESAAEAIETKRNAFDLPLRSHTIAEIVVAGVEGRACRFEERARGSHPVNVALVPLPPARDLYIDVRGDRARELTAKELSAAIPSLVARFMLKTLKRTASADDDRDISNAVEGALRVHGNRGLETRRWYYVVCADLGVDAEGDRDAVWRVTCDALRQSIPSLRLIRLTGGADTADHYEIIEVLNAMMPPTSLPPKKTPPDSRGGGRSKRR